MKKVFFLIFPVLFCNLYLFSQENEPTGKIRYKPLEINVKSMIFKRHDKCYSHTLILDKMKKRGYLRFQFETINLESQDTLRLDGIAFCIVKTINENIDLEMTRDESGSDFLYYEYYCNIDSCQLLLFVDMYDSRVKVIDNMELLKNRFPDFRFGQFGTLRRYP